MDCIDKTSFQRALERRIPLWSTKRESNIGRLVHSDADGFPGLTVDKLGAAVLIEAHNRQADPIPLAQIIEKEIGPRTPIYIKERWSTSWRGRAGWQIAGPLCHPEFAVRENGVFFWLRLTADEHIGLFLDSRKAREKVRQIASGRRILNLFAYTGGFGVAAALGGAMSTTNIDNKRSALESAKRNYTLNGLSYDSRTFLRDDAFKYLKRMAKGRGRYDLIILDPPATSRRPGNRWFNVKTGYVGLVAKCLKLLSDEGEVLAGINVPGISDTQFEGMLIDAAGGLNKKISITEQISPGLDFPNCPNRPVGKFVLFSTS